MKYIAHSVVTLLLCLDLLGCKSGSNLQESASNQPQQPAMEAVQNSAGNKPSPHRGTAKLNSQSERSSLKTTPEKSQDTTRLYVIRVVDGQSQAPVDKAKVNVELVTTSNPKWSGLTDSHGFFEFEWDAIPQSVRTHISIQAKGFASLDQYSLLTADKLIELSRAH